MNNQFSQQIPLYAGRVLGVAISNSTKAFEYYAQATKQGFDRSNAYLASLSTVKQPDEAIKLQDRAVKEEVVAYEGYVREAYDLATNSANDVVELADLGIAAADDLVTQQAQAVSQSIPNGKDQPYGSVIRDMINSQVDAYRNFSSIYSKAVKVGSDNLKNATKTATKTAIQVADQVADKNGSTKKRK